MEVPGNGLIENLDRLSREEEVPACHLLLSILLAGVRVVQQALPHPRPRRRRAADLRPRM